VPWRWWFPLLLLLLFPCWVWKGGDEKSEKERKAKEGDDEEGGEEEGEEREEKD